MRLICLHCQGVATVPDDAAGKDASSSELRAIIPDAGALCRVGIAGDHAAGLRSATDGVFAVVVSSARAAGLRRVGGFLDQSATSTPLQPSGYTRSRGITISPKVVEWLPAILLSHLRFS